MHPDQTPLPLRGLIDAIANRPNQTLILTHNPLWTHFPR